MEGSHGSGRGMVAGCTVARQAQDVFALMISTLFVTRPRRGHSRRRYTAPWRRHPVDRGEVRRKGLSGGDHRQDGDDMPCTHSREREAARQ